MRLQIKIKIYFELFIFNFVYHGHLEKKIQRNLTLVEKYFYRQIIIETFNLTNKITDLLLI